MVDVADDGEPAAEPLVLHRAAGGARRAGAAAGDRRALPPHLRTGRRPAGGSPPCTSSSTSWETSGTTCSSTWHHEALPLLRPGTASPRPSGPSTSTPTSRSGCTSRRWARPRPRSCRRRATSRAGWCGRFATGSGPTCRARCARSSARRSSTTEVSTLRPGRHRPPTFTMTPGTMADKTQIDGSHRARPRGRRHGRDVRPRRPGQDLRRRADRRALHRAPGPRDAGEGGRLHAGRARGLSRPGRRTVRCSRRAGPFTHRSQLPLDGGPASTHCVGRQPSVARQGRAPGPDRWVRGRETEGGCRGAARGPTPSCGRPSGASAPPWRRRRGGTDGGGRRGLRRRSGGHSRPGRRRTPFHVEQHGIDFIPDERAVGRARGHLRHVGRRQRADRVLHLRRHPDDLRVHLRPGRSRSSSSATCPIFLLGLCSLQGPNAGTTVFAINRARSGPTARGPSPSSTGSPRSASRSRASSSSSAPAWC